MRDSHVIVMGQCEEETARHDVACNNVSGAIRIYRCASIEQVCSNFVRVEDNDGLAGRVEVDEIA
jgi:hypothetical protein